MRTNIVIALAIIALAGGCAKKPATPSEATIQANAIVGGSFRGTKEYWFALEVSGSAQPRLTEFHNPRTSLLAQPISSTDKMNGVTSEPCSRAILSSSGSLTPLKIIPR